MLRWNEKLILRLFDKAKKLNTLYYYQLFKSSCNWSIENVEKYRYQKLQELLSYSYKNIPYYTSIFNSLKIKPEDIRSVNDLSLLPVLTRHDIANNYNDLVNTKHHYRSTFPSSSSGTTGIPVKYIHDSFGESAGIAAGFTLLSLSGWQVGKKTLHIWGNPESISKWKSSSSRLKRKVFNQSNYPAFYLNDPNNYPILLKKNSS